MGTEAWDSGSEDALGRAVGDNSLYHNDHDREPSVEQKGCAGQKMSLAEGVQVEESLNGIAYPEEADVLLLTGKL